jgi:hypothetical protein
VVDRVCSGIGTAGRGQRPRRPTRPRRRPPGGWLTPRHPARPRPAQPATALRRTDSTQTLPVARTDSSPVNTSNQLSSRSVPLQAATPTMSRFRRSGLPSAGGSPAPLFSLPSSSWPHSPFGQSPAVAQRPVRPAVSRRAKCVHLNQVSPLSPPPSRTTAGCTADQSRFLGSDHRGGLRNRSRGCRSAGTHGLRL